MINWLQLLNQLNSSHWCLRNVQVLNWCWWHFTHTFCTQYSRVYAVYLAFHVLGWGCQFLSLFSQNNEHTELTVLLFFRNQHYHDFQSNVGLFPSVAQGYTQPYSFSERIKLIICQIRHELTVTIHEISTSWKTLDSGPDIYWIFAYLCYITQCCNL